MASWELFQWGIRISGGPRRDPPPKPEKDMSLPEVLCRPLSHEEWLKSPAGARQRALDWARKKGWFVETDHVLYYWGKDRDPNSPDDDDGDDEAECTYDAKCIHYAWVFDKEYYRSGSVDSKQNNVCYKKIHLIKTILQKDKEGLQSFLTFVQVWFFLNDMDTEKLEELWDQSKADTHQMKKKLLEMYEDKPAVWNRIIDYCSERDRKLEKRVR